MQKITSVAGLKNAIQLLEAEKEVKGQQFKEQLLFTYDSFRPINIIKRTLNDFFSTPDLTEKLSGTTVGVASGILFNKLFVGRSGNIFRKMIGSLIQVGVSKLVSNNPETIKSIGQFIAQQFFHKKK